MLCYSCVKNSNFLQLIVGHSLCHCSIRIHTRSSWEKKILLESHYSYNCQPSVLFPQESCQFRWVTRTASVKQPHLSWVHVFCQFLAGDSGCWQGLESKGLTFLYHSTTTAFVPCMIRGSCSGLHPVGT